MDKKPYTKILQFIDDYFYDYNNRNNADGFYEEFENTIFSNQYINLDDFMYYNTNEFEYKMYSSLLEQYGDVEDDKRVKIIEVIYNIVFYSEMSDESKTKIASFLARYKILFLDSDDYRKAASGDEFNTFEGSFGKVFVLNEEFVKKQLKPEYWDDKDIASRFKNEYAIQNRMKELGAQVLEVFDYDGINHSFLMQRADIDLADYFEENKVCMKNKVQMCEEIFAAMKIAHDNNIYHRDLHIGNILLLEDHPYVSDFGFAKDANHLRSKLSTISPKPTHLYLAPEGFKDFTQLDSVSDIYSIGKIIDYMMGDGQLGQNHPFKLIVEKSTKSAKEDRYQTISALQDAFNRLYKSLLEGDNIEQINNDIHNGIYNVNVETYLMKLVANDKLSSQIVSNDWNLLSDVICKCENENQLEIVNNIQDTFVNATGYGGWGNYDLFARLAYNIIQKSDILSVRKVAYEILDHCASVRYGAKDLLDELSYDIIELLK